MTDYMDEEMGAEVIPLPSADPVNRMNNEREDALDALPVRTKQEHGACKHRGTWVSESARTLMCRKCGVPVDPIDALVRLARNREFYANQARWLRGDVERLSREVDELKRQERNAKSRIRSARRRRGDRDALIAAATAGVAINGYRRWEDLGPEQREVVLEKVRLIVEAYAGAFEQLGEEVA